jgi:hypothetical protein
VVELVAVMLRIRYVSCSYLGPGNGYPEGFRDVLQCVQENVHTLPQIKLISVIHIFLNSHYKLLIMPSDTTQTELLTMSVNNLRIT